MEKPKRNKYDLTSGSIFDKLLMVSLPIMGTQITQMAYNLTDMLWLGRVGSGAVAASGTAGMFLWLSMAFMMFGRMGAEIGVSQNLGRGDQDAAKRFAQTAVTISAVLGVAYGLFLFAGGEFLISFFKIQEAEVTKDALTYLMIVSLGLPPAFITASITGIFNGSGNTRIPFYINAVGLCINMVLDPYMILTLNMGIAGAAYATIIAQIVACVLSVMALAAHKSRPFEKFAFLKITDKKTVFQIFKWAVPISVESFLFTFLSMFISRYVAEWGSGAMATQRISSQIESLSWLIAGGFSSALTAYIGQNFGAGKWSRIHKGYNISAVIMIVWGIIVTFVLYFFGGAIFSLFLPGEPEIIEMGAEYLRILAVFQVLSCLEGISAGAFRGLGKTLPPSLVSTITNFTRVLGARYLSRTAFGLNGIWWAVSIGMAVRGIWILAWYLIYSKRTPKVDIPATGV